MSKKKRILVSSGIVLLVLIAVGGWAFFHWLGFMLQKPMPVHARYDWKMKVLGGNGTPGFADGTSSRFNKPIRLAPFGADAVLVADFNNHAIRVVHLNGQTETLAGGPDKRGYQDGPAEKARFNSPHGVAVRDDGVIAVAEVRNNIIRLITPVKTEDAGQQLRYVVSTLAGTPGETGFRDGPAEKALFRYPHAVAWGPNRELYVADIGNARIREIRAGQVTTMAGTGKFGREDGPLDTGRLQYPMDLSIDSDGHLWIADAGTSIIRRYDPGKGLSTPWPDIRLDMPHGLSVAPGGSVAIAEMFANRIVLLKPDNGIIRLCGTGESGPGENQLNKPAAILIHAGYVWIADLSNHRILIAEWQSS